MNAPIDLDAIERRILLERIAELEGTVEQLRDEINEHEENLRACAVTREALMGEVEAARAPQSLLRAIKDLLARLDGREDIGSKTRLAILAVRQELEAAKAGA